MDNLIQAHVYFSDDEEASDNEPELYIKYNKKNERVTRKILKALNPVSDLAFLNKQTDNLKINDIKKLIAVNFLNDMMVDTKYIVKYIMYFIDKCYLSKRQYRKVLYTVIIFDMIFKNKTFINSNNNFLKVVIEKLKELNNVTYRDDNNAIFAKKRIKELYNIWYNGIKNEFNIN